jgi:hypothetical protein
MGLDTSHDAWHGAYSAFSRWRCYIAKVAGMPPLELMEGFWGHGFDRACIVDHDATNLARNTIERIESTGNLPIPWSALKPDPLHVLLHHNDCGGEISPEDCAEIADRLEELLPLMSGDFGGHVGDVTEKTRKFIAGCRAAAAAGEPLDFH